MAFRFSSQRNVQSSRQPAYEPPKIVTSFCCTDIIPSNFYRSYVPFTRVHIPVPPNPSLHQQTRIHDRKSLENIAGLQNGPNSGTSTASYSLEVKTKRNCLKFFIPFFWYLVVTTQLFLMALPATMIALVQASIENRTIIPSLVSFILVFAVSLVSGLLTYWVFRKRRQMLKQHTLYLNEELQKWRRDAKEKTEELRILRSVGDRLRSISRGRERSIGSNRTGRAKSADVRERSREAHRLGLDSERQITNRGRSTCPKAINSHELETSPRNVIELGLENHNSAYASPARSKGSVARARAGLVDHHLTKPLPAIPLGIRAQRSLKLFAQWDGSSNTLTAPPSSAYSSTQEETHILTPSDLEPKEASSPPYQVTSLDLYVVPEMRRQRLERRQLEHEIDELNPTHAVGAETQAFQPGRVFSGPCILEAEPAGHFEGFDVTFIDDLEIVRRGNGGLGNRQSDENFEINHSLAADAISMTESQNEDRRAASLQMVRGWEDGSSLAVGRRGDDTDNAASSNETLQNAESGNGLSRGLDTLQRPRDSVWSIEQAREQFQDWYQRSRFSDSDWLDTDASQRDPVMGEIAPGPGYI
ncbi:hypothetical protein MMC19_004046 [Ptychographa xylographoides]|nr:hypothetical protein [Ptychographa xylographoides]